MDLIFAGWHPSPKESGRVVQVPANYGGHGFAVETNVTPVFVPPGGPKRDDPHIPTWNRIAPIIWREYVLSPAEIEALRAAGYVEYPDQSPAVYTQPGTASVSFT